MKRVITPLFLAFILAGCGDAEPGIIEAAKSEAKERKFEILSMSSDGGDWFTDPSVTLEVSFGEEGCTGSITFKNGTARMGIELPIPGSPTETTYIHVDDPQVDQLRGNTAFKDCFTSNGSQSTA